MKKIIVLSFLSAVFFITCSRDKFVEVETICATEVTYEKDIAPIVALTCSYAGCHDGIAQSGYGSYEDLESILSSNLFEDEVVIERTMPPFYAVDGPTTLTEEQYNLMACWVEAGYPKE